MELDLREIVFMWLNREDYYGEQMGDCDSAVLSLNEGLVGNRRAKTSGKVVGYDNHGENWDDVCYYGSQDRIEHWMEIDRALNKLTGDARDEFIAYVEANKDRRLDDWDGLTVSLALALNEVLCYANYSES
jgi:hypothetical protein